MPGIDETIEAIGLAATIVRAAGDVSTYIYIDPKLKSAPYDYKSWMMTDSTVVSGDLILMSGYHYLVVGVSKDERVGEFFKYNVRLFRCNHVISVNIYDRPNRKFTSVKTDIPCLVVDKGIAQITDKGLIIPGFSGTDESFTLYCQPNGITEENVLQDENGNSLRPAGVISPYFTDGLVAIPFTMET